MTKFFYRVQKGDTVIALSERFLIPPVKLISDNKLKKEVAEGDLIYIENSQSAKTYKVKLFDTAENVAKKFNMTAEELLSLNGSPYIFYGQVLLVE